MPTSPPPEIPQDVDPNVARYLRRLGTWAFQEIDAKVPKNEAVAQLLLNPSDQKPPKAVYALTVKNTAPTVVQVNPVPLGKGSVGP